MFFRYICILLLVSCSDVDLNNPYDSGGGNYLGANALADDDGDGVYNFRDQDSEFFDPTNPYFNDGPTDIKDGTTISLTTVSGNNWIEASTPTEFLVSTSSDKLKAVKIDYESDGVYDDSLTSTAIATAENKFSKIYLTAGVYDVVATVTSNIDSVYKDTLPVVVYSNSLTTGDTVAPVIILNTPINLVIAKGVSWPAFDPGYTAVDAVDGDVTQIVKSSITDSENKVASMDAFTAVSGKYTITYSAIDFSGNISTATRVVEVSNSTSIDQKPEIFLIGDTTVFQELHKPYIDLGATAADPEDGDLTLQIITDTSAVDVNVKGEYVVTYTVTDSKGKIVTLIRKVTVGVKDVDPPEIQFPSINKTFRMFQGSDWSVASGLQYTAVDIVEGDISNKVTFSATNEAGATIGMDTLTNTLGTYTITLNVADAQGNSAIPKTVTFIVEPNDEGTTNLIITIDGDSIITIGKFSTFTYPDVIEAFEIDGAEFRDMREMVVIDKTVDTASAGVYTVVYSITNDAGAKGEDQIIVHVKPDTIPPVMKLKGTKNLGIAQNASYVDEGVTVTDNYDQDLDNDVKVTITNEEGDIVKMSDIGPQNGVYTITYSVSDRSGNRAPDVKRTVTVGSITFQQSEIGNSGRKRFTVNGTGIFTIPASFNHDRLQIYWYDGDKADFNISLNGANINPGQNDHGNYSAGPFTLGEKTITITTTKAMGFEFTSRR